MPLLANEINLESTDSVSMTVLSDQEIRQVVEHALASTGSRESLNRLFGICHTMATAYVKLKAANGAVHLEEVGMSASDFALDAIAELFRRDQYHLAQFRALRDRAGESPSGVHNELRRVVFGAVNQAAIRLLRQLSPDVARLIRNVKLGLKDHETACLTHSQIWVMIGVRDADPLEDHPIFPDELLAIEFWNEVHVGSTMSRLLSRLCDILRGQSLYRRQYPVTAFAQLIQPNFAGEGVPSEQTAEPAFPREDDLIALARRVVENKPLELLNSYSQHGKIGPAEVSAYRDTIVDILIASYVGTNGDSTSFFKILSRHVPGLEKREYLNKHRSRLEYAVRLAKDQMNKGILSELGISAID